MRTREISYEQWQPFFRDFTQLHQGEHVHVETLGTGQLGAKSQLCDLPLVGLVSACPKSGEDEWVEIIAGATPASHGSHWIAKPSKVLVAEEDNGQTVAVEIESSDRSITMIRFEPSGENMPGGFRVA